MSTVRSYDTNSIRVHHLKKAFHVFVKFLKGWKLDERISFRLYKNNDGITLLADAYEWEVKFTIAEFVCGLSYLYTKRSIKINDHY